jgi:hypothetical protein
LFFFYRRIALFELPAFEIIPQQRLKNQFSV